MPYATSLMTAIITVIGCCLFLTPLSAQHSDPGSAALIRPTASTGSFRYATDTSEEPGDANLDAFAGDCVEHAASGEYGSWSNAGEQPVAPFSAAFDRVSREAASSGPPSSLMAVDGRREKSGFQAILYSLVLPGMGELYAERFDKGKYPLITEAALWLGLIGVNAYGNWVQQDARLFAVQHAGLDPTGKDDRFFFSIENYSTLYDYNNQRLIEHNLAEVYPDEATWRWEWDSDANRLAYKDQRIRADEMHNNVTFFVLGMIANRIWSAIQAGFAVKDYNASLADRLQSLPSMQAQLTTFAGRTDGMRLVFSW